jgi:hypothetical protein
MSKLKLSLCLALLLPACTSVEGEFPSLERRAYESDDPVAIADAEPQAPAVLIQSLKNQVDSLVARHSKAEAAYARDLPTIRSVAQRAAGSAVGSESWVNAHLQLSRLDQARADSVAVVRDFDALIARAGDTDAAMVPLLVAAQKPVADAVTAQNAEIERLSRLIGE